jgi:hypothetical protein
MKEKMTPDVQETIEITDAIIDLINEASEVHIGMAATITALQAVIVEVFGKGCSAQFEVEMEKLFGHYGLERRELKSTPTEEETKFWNLMTNMRLYDKPVAFPKKKAKRAAK